jgi:kinesin family protein 18/19
VSSRSHAVFLLTIEAKDDDDQTGAIKVAKLNMIDLAGSERAAYTNNKGLRMIEGANINKSLLALANCINALSGNIKGNKKPHVPYRDSKLTRLLKESLCGNCRTVMICNISPAVTAYEDTLNTLKYADRAKSIKTYTKKNIKMAGENSTNQMMSEYADIINNLKKENLQLKTLVQKRKWRSNEQRPCQSLTTS